MWDGRVMAESESELVGVDLLLIYILFPFSPVLLDGEVHVLVI